MCSFRGPVWVNQIDAILTDMLEANGAIGTCGRFRNGKQDRALNAIIFGMCQLRGDHAARGTLNRSAMRWNACTVLTGPPVRRPRMSRRSARTDSDSAMALVVTAPMAPYSVGSVLTRKSMALDLDIRILIRPS